MSIGRLSWRTRNTGLETRWRQENNCSGRIVGCRTTRLQRRAGPTGLEGLDFNAPSYAGAKKDCVRDHCSAFAATGPATRDGKMVIGHVTWWPLMLAEQTNVMLDIKLAQRNLVLRAQRHASRFFARGAGS